MTRNILTYDNDCGFCTRAANWLVQRSNDTNAVAFQDLDYESFGLTYDEVSTAAYFVRSDGRIFRGTVVMGHALLSARRPWQFLGWPLVLPVTSWIGRMCYPVLARNRHRLPGGTASCDVRKQMGDQS